MKGKIILIALTAVLLAAAVIIEKKCHLTTWQLLLVYLVPYLIIGFDTLKEAAEGIAHGDAFDEHFLMSVATIGALCIGFLPGAETAFPEAVFVMLFFQVGELFEGYAEGKSRDSIAHLMDIRPDVANVERDGRTEAVDPASVRIGEILVVRPGEKVPLDGIIVEGTTSVDTKALTGESVPRELEA
ncbi:MAG: heavy metal translocating P-type ATPase, partial [Bacteroidales bacterium]|nr:heavy metal translocating P-type ATPase [Bacteroidales bacterium]